MNTELNETETKIFDILLKTLCHNGLENLQLHVADGWVRDKLRGKDYGDIDIAVEDMRGIKFAEKVKDYLYFVGKEQAITYFPGKLQRVAAARMSMFNIWLDFFKLGGENNSDNSPISSTDEQKYATEKEKDACRRDITINRYIEDHTGRGTAYLKEGRIATTTPPELSLVEDPKRVLRAIRYGAKFGFFLDDDIKKAAASDEVKAALMSKVSRDRINVETDLMVSGNQPAQAISFLCDLNLFWDLFSPNDILSKSEGLDRLCASYLDASWNLIQLIGYSTFNDDERRLSLYAAMFLPLRKVNLNCMLVYDNCLLAKFLSLLPYFESSEVVQLSKVDWGSDVPHASKESKLQVLTGILLRNKECWRVALLLSTLLYPRDVVVHCAGDNLNKTFKLEERRALFKAAENAIVNLGLDKVWDLKPLLSTQDITNVLQLKSGGPLIREWVSYPFSFSGKVYGALRDQYIDFINGSSSSLQQKTNSIPPPLAVELPTPLKLVY